MSVSQPVHKNILYNGKPFKSGTYLCTHERDEGSREISMIKYPKYKGNLQKQTFLKSELSKCLEQFSRLPEIFYRHICLMSGL